jgi:hypothetical protein
MLGLNQFSTPQFYVPQLPQTERPLHKAKDFMSFLNSLQWKADDEAEDTPDVKFDASDGMDDRRLAESTAMGLDGNLESGHDTTQRVGSTRWDNMNDSQIWDQAIQSLVTGEDPITKGIGDNVGGDLAPAEVDEHKLSGKSRFAGWTPAQIQDYLNSPMMR